MEAPLNSKRIHPYHFTLWIAMGSIVMMFAGLTSAYLVKRNQANWQGFDLPGIFLYSTVAIVISSITIQLAVRSIRARNLVSYKRWLFATVFLGLLFIAMQWQGFVDLNNQGIRLIGAGSNVAGSFIAVIAGLHMVHVLGGVVALLAIVYASFKVKQRTYASVNVEVAATYWHFVDLLWIYLFIFLSLVS